MVVLGGVAVSYERGTPVPEQLLVSHVVASNVDATLSTVTQVNGGPILL